MAQGKGEAVKANKKYEVGKETSGNLEVWSSVSHRVSKSVERNTEEIVGQSYIVLP